MKLPRDLNGEELARYLKAVGYQVSRQTGSHLRLTTERKGEHHVTIPKHKPLRVGTLSGILKAIAEHLEVDKQELLDTILSD